MAERMNGKVVVVTGSTSGIGEGVARRLAAEGARVVVSGTKVALGEEIVDGIERDGGQAIFIRADLRREAECTYLIEATIERWDRLDVLVNNAGVFPSVPFEEMSIDQWDQVFTVNVRGVFLCTRAAIGIMRPQGGGAIINIGSTLAYGASLDRLGYACSKGALLTMTKSLARELLPDRIRVNWVTVGWVATPGEIALREQTHQDGMAFLEQQARKAPLGRLETVEETATGVLYLASDDASHVTGCELNISGGRHI